MKQSLTAQSANALETLGCELAAEVLHNFGRLRLRATGASMLPVVWPGDTLLVQSREWAAALPGDMVLFRRHGRLVAHRVVSRSQAHSTLQWVTRGDSVAGDDAPVSGDDLLGRVTAIERGSMRLIPRQSRASRLIAWVLRRSDTCTRLLLHFANPRYGFGGALTNEAFAPDH